jgi:hypothetical protein
MVGSSSDILDELGNIHSLGGIVIILLLIHTTKLISKEFILPRAYLRSSRSPDGNGDRPIIIIPKKLILVHLFKDKCFQVVFSRVTLGQPSFIVAE